VANRWIRFLLAVLAIAAASAAVYRAVENERLLTRHASATRDTALAAEAALENLEELRSALHAYVAPGQGVEFWSARSRVLLVNLRSALLNLDAPARAAGVSLAEPLDACDQLAAAERRARAYAADEQSRLAGEVIFTEARDLFEGMRLQIVQARDALAFAAEAQRTKLRREQTYLLGGGIAVLALVMLLLVPTGRAASEPAALQSPTMVRELEPDNVRALESANVEAASGPAATDTSDVAPEPPFEAATLASLCTDLAAASTGDEIASALDRTRELLDARGVILWLITSDGTALRAAGAAGYDERIVARIGTIPRTAHNLTADAFRTNSARTSAAANGTPAALAVPLPAPGGPAGVLSAELTPGAELKDVQLRAAQVIAAQLGTVLGAADAKSLVADAESSSAAAQSSP
jgi:hypothetical protein